MSHTVSANILRVVGVSVCMALLAGCSNAGGGGNFGAAGALSGDKGGAKSPTAPDSANSSAQDPSSGTANDNTADERANVPQQVSGAFLTCGYQDNQSEIKSQIEARTSVAFGCGLFHQQAGKIVLTDIRQIGLTAKVMCADLKLVTLHYDRLATTSPLQVVVNVPADRLPCTIQLGTTGANSQTAVFRKAIPTVRQTNVKGAGFNVAQDMQANGMTIGPDGIITSTGASGDAPTWSYVAGVLNKVYTPELIIQERPVVVDNGTTTYSPWFGKGSTTIDYGGNYTPATDTSTDTASATATSTGTATGGTAGGGGNGTATSQGTDTSVATLTATATATSRATSTASGTSTGSNSSSSGGSSSSSNSNNNSSSSSN